MPNLAAAIMAHGPFFIRVILRIISAVFFLYGFSLLTEGLNTLRNTDHPLGPSVSQAIGVLGIGYLLLSALLWAAA